MRCRESIQISLSKTSISATSENFVKFEKRLIKKLYCSKAERVREAFLITHKNKHLQDNTHGAALADNLLNGNRRIQS